MDESTMEVESSNLLRNVIVKTVSGGVIQAGVGHVADMLGCTNAMHT